MQHRIRAAGLILDPEQRILLVREMDSLTGGEFWVPPGGGLEPQDVSIIDCLRRELLEETGLPATTVGRLVYLREFSETSRAVHHIELFFEVRAYHGTLNSGWPADSAAPPTLSRHARWFHQTDLQNLRIYPEELKREFWEERLSGIQHTKYLGTQLENSGLPQSESCKTI